MLMNIAKILQNMKSIKWMSIEKKNIVNEKKPFFIIIKKYFNLENFASL